MIDFYKHSLDSNKKVFKDLLSGIPEEVFNWRESYDKWSLLEIICHLHDEEKEDFRARLASVINNPDQSFIPIDPVMWVTERKYSEQHYDEVLEKFLSERQYSLNWLNSLSKPDWNRAYHHPKIGPMSGSFIIANWLAHDYLHIRQIVRIKYNYLKNNSSQPLNYAGDW